MSYYEKRIKALEQRVAEMAQRERLKCIPVEAKLVERIAQLQAENKVLRKAGDAMAYWIDHQTNEKGYPFCEQWDAVKGEDKAK
jgi:hypothetical protein